MTAKERFAELDEVEELRKYEDRSIEELLGLIGRNQKVLDTKLNLLLLIATEDEVIR